MTEHKFARLGDDKRGKGKGQGYEWWRDQTAACLSRIDLIQNKVAVPDRIWMISSKIAKQPQA